MSLQYILGSSGSGKSTYIYEKIIKDSIEHPEGKYLVIVPDQYTMETQSLLVNMHPNHCIMNIDILSFNRLAYRVFEELAMSTLDVLEDSGKLLILRKLAVEHESELGVLGSGIHRSGYISQIKSLISEFSQYNITPDKLRDLIESEDVSEAFRRRLSDLLVIYEAFLSFIDKRYLTSETILSSMCEVLKESDKVKDAVVVFDGFTGFTPVQVDAFEEMLRLSKKCYVTMTIDVSESLFGDFTENELFNMSKKFAARLKRSAERAGVTLEQPILLDGSMGRFAEAGPLAFLEKNIFRNGNARFDGDCTGAIRVLHNSSPREELRQVAIEISKLIRNEGYRYSDIAVVCADPSSYAHMVPEIWDRYDIPYFLDIRNAVSFTPLVMMMDGLFDMMRLGFTRESVFKYIRSGLAGISAQEADEFEDYVLAYNVRGKRYQKPFVYAKRIDETRLDAINEIRARFIEPLMPFIGLPKKTTVQEFAKCLYALFTGLNVHSQMETLKTYFETEEKNQVMAAIYKQLYRKVLMLLDKMVAIIGNEEMSLTEFYEIYKTGLAGATVTVIPQARDAVVFGDIERTRLRDVHALFLIGAGDHAIPKPVENGGIISDIDRERLADKLKEKEIEMAPSDREKTFMQRFYLYLMLTKAQEKLYVIYPSVNGAGEAVNKSYLVDALIRMYGAKEGESTDGRLVTEHISSRPILDSTFSKQEAMTTAISRLREIADSTDTATDRECFDELLPAVLQWLESEGVYKDIVDNLFHRHEPDVVSPDVMTLINSLNPGGIKGSVSRFETYASCGYSYFLKYILYLKEGGGDTVSTIDAGNYYHEIMHLFGEALQRRNIKWAELADEICDEIFAQVSQMAEETSINPASRERRTDSFVVDRLSATARSNIDIIRRQIMAGTLEPSLFEHTENAVLKDAQGDTVASLKCKIDRIDIDEKDEGTLVRIVDYKSSDHDIDLNMVYEGISIQLPMYMGIALEAIRSKKGADVSPAAMLYYHVKDELYDNGDGLEGEALTSAIFAGHKMKGQVCSSDDAVAANDAHAMENGKSDVVPVSYKKDGSFAAASKTLSSDEFGMVTDYVTEGAIDTADRIRSGQFEAQPYLYEDRTPCKYCSMRAVCGFTNTVPGYSQRIIDKNKPEAVLLAMKDEMSDGGMKKGGQE